MSKPKYRAGEVIYHTQGTFYKASDDTYTSLCLFWSPTKRVWVSSVAMNVEMFRHAKYGGVFK